MDKKEQCKTVVDRFLGEVKTVAHTMIDGEHFNESPVSLVKEAIEYLDEKYEELRKKANDRPSPENTPKGDA